MIDLGNYRIIDLSYDVVPGEAKIDGRYLHGVPFMGRNVEVQEFNAFESRMHFIQSQTHVGTHAEAPYKYSETGADCASMPISSYLGEAAACDFSGKRASEPITGTDFHEAGVRSGDIVLAWGPSDVEGDPPYLSIEAVEWLVDAHQAAEHRKPSVLAAGNTGRFDHRRCQAAPRRHPDSRRPAGSGSDQETARLLHRSSGQAASRHGIVDTCHRPRRVGLTGQRGTRDLLATSFCCSNRYVACDW